MAISPLRCPTCGSVRLVEDRFCRRCGRSFATPLVRAAARVIAPLVARRPASVWQGLALLVLGATVTAVRRWAVRRVVRALLPRVLGRALGSNGGAHRPGARVTELTIILRQRIDERELR